MTNESLRDKIKKDIVQNVDGFCYYWPPTGAGMFSAHVLRQIADILDEMNESWQNEIDEYFEMEKALNASKTS